MLRVVYLHWSITAVSLHTLLGELLKIGRDHTYTWTMKYTNAVSIANCCNPILVQYPHPWRDASQPAAGVKTRNERVLLQ